MPPGVPLSTDQPGSKQPLSNLCRCLWAVALPCPVSCGTEQSFALPSPEVLMKAENHEKNIHFNTKKLVTMYATGVMQFWVAKGDPYLLYSFPVRTVLHCVWEL